MSYTALVPPSSSNFITGDPWSYQNANRTKDNLADHETRLLLVETPTTDTLTASSAGATWKRTSLTELITLSTAAAATDSTLDLLPANSIIRGVAWKVPTTFTVTTGFTLGSTGSAARFQALTTAYTAGNSGIGLAHVDTTGAQVTAGKLRVTNSAAPGAGAIRVTVFADTFTVPTS